MNHGVNGSRVQIAAQRLPINLIQDAFEPYAAARWARAVVEIVDSPDDLRFVSEWCKWIRVAPGALRNWCRTAGITPRTSLVFGRMLRAVLLTMAGSCRPEHVLDSVDLRTVARLLRRIGFPRTEEFPRSVDQFLQRQTLIRDEVVLNEVRRALQRRGQGRSGQGDKTGR